MMFVIYFEQFGFLNLYSIACSSNQSMFGNVVHVESFTDISCHRMNRSSLSLMGWSYVYIFFVGFFRINDF